MSKVKTNTTIISIFGIVAIAIVISYFKETDRTLPNYATVIGTIFSIIGLAIAYVNIVALKDASEEVSKNVKSALKKVQQINSVSDISKAIKTIHEVQQFIRDSKIELAHLRMLDVKFMLLRFSSLEQLHSMVSEQNYIDLVINFGIDLNSLNGFIMMPKRKVDFAKINNNLEGLSTHLSEFENKLKQIEL